MQSEADLTSKEFRQDTYPTYDRLREMAPVCRVRTGRGKFAWLVTRYDDVLTAIKDTRFTKDRQSLPDGAVADQRREWQHHQPDARGAIFKRSDRL